MKIIRSLALSLSMFTKIPMPRVKWEGENMGLVLGFLPISGMIIGLALFGWERLCTFLRLGGIIRGAGFTLLPLLISGGIHMDGFCDTSDALASHGDPERKREILKDSHVGAFGVLWVCGWMLADFAFHTEVEVSNGAILRLCLIPVISRSFGALSSLLFPAAGANGLLGTFQTNASKGWTLGLISLVAAAALGGMTYLGRAPGAAAGMAALLLFAILRSVAKKQFSGMSGDLAGWYITLSELMMLAALVIVEKAVIL